EKANIVRPKGLDAERAAKGVLPDRDAGHMVPVECPATGPAERLFCGREVWRDVPVHSPREPAEETRRLQGDYQRVAVHDGCRLIASSRGESLPWASVPE